MSPRKSTVKQGKCDVIWSRRLKGALSESSPQSKAVKNNRAGRVGSNPTIRRQAIGDNFKKEREGGSE